MRRAGGALIVLAALARFAHAYPQFQLSKDQTCSSCHLSPSGGLLLDENGLDVAESISTFGGPPEAAHGALVGPDWLQLGGDLRGGAGLVAVRGPHGGAFPMQADGDVAVRGGGFTVLATLGVQQGHDVASVFVSRQHWIMWQPHAGASDGLYLRVGRFIPVYTLRFAEHTAFTQRYGQAPLYGEAYGAAVEYIEPGWELHATGFVHDPVQDSVEHGDGGAAYGEVRLAKIASIGLEGRYAESDQDRRIAGGATGKLWLAPANLLLEGEAQVIRQTFEQGAASGTARTQVVSYLLASWFLHEGFMLDLGAGQFDENLAVEHVDLEAIDLDLHWFATSHWELLSTNRIQTIALGAGGATSGYALLQLHYRL